MAAPHTYLRKLTKILRQVRGGLTVADVLRRMTPTLDGAVWITDFDGDLSMKLNLAEHMQNQIFWYGYYSLDVVPLLKRVLRRGDVVMDCGANVGELSLVARNAVGGAGHVYAFEPMPEIADQLTANVDANGFSNITIVRNGVSSGTGVASIYQATSRSADGYWNRGLGTLFSCDGRSSVAATIELISLDAFVDKLQLSRLDLVKLDIEGGELPALLGASNTLARLRPALVIELNEQMCAIAGYSMREVMNFLESLNYSVWRIGRRGRLSRLSCDSLRPFQNIYCVAKA